MRAAERPASLIDALVALAFAPWILAVYLWDISNEKLAKRKAAKATPKRKPRAKAAPKTRPLTAAEHRKLRGVSPALRIINGGKA